VNVPALAREIVSDFSRRVQSEGHHVERVPLHEQDQIFDRFVRGADAKAHRIRGTGIGLSMARDIMLGFD
jgi:signal transduction histidine kinase